ncbi:MAG: hypothetical protein H0U74_10755 [Bradymonadaceae bacterium]|nr:hypothetical protein [Lujinxingiaceae bacterium]
MTQFLIRKSRPRGVALGLSTGCALLFATACGDILDGPSSEEVSVAPVTPYVPEHKNPTCEDLGLGTHSTKFEDPKSGTYTLLGDKKVVLDVNNPYFDWKSSIDIEAVIVKGGPTANVYEYDPERTYDKGLHSPINPNNGKPYGLSHITFCYNLRLDVKKDAKPHYKRTHKWDIKKSVYPAYWALFDGDSGTSKYTVDVTKKGYHDSDHSVSGKIYIHNPWPYDAKIIDVKDIISDYGQVPVDCGKQTFPITLKPGDKLVCHYDSKLPDDKDRKNKVEVKTDPKGKIKGDYAYADIKFGMPTKELYKSVKVEDTFNSKTTVLGTFSKSETIKYDRTFKCPKDEGKHKNVAKIVETEQYDTAYVEVKCFKLIVKKDAKAHYDKRYDWKIDKKADKDHVSLKPGEKVAVKYAVKVDLSKKDYGKGYYVVGEIKVTNPHPKRSARILSVSDIVSPDIAAHVDCGVSFPFDLAPLSTLTCKYKAELPDDKKRLNKAKVVHQNYDYDHKGDGKYGGKTYYEASAWVDFAYASIKKLDKCVKVYDTHKGYLGEVCADTHELPYVFKYTLKVGPYSEYECGAHEIDNCAKFITKDTKTEGKSCWKLKVDVYCKKPPIEEPVENDFQGCTPGYWKNHLSAWQGFTPSQTLNSVFMVPGALGLGGNSLLDALNYGGGPGAVGGARILLRAAVASLLNAAHSGVNYPLTTAQIISQVNAALATGNRSAMLALATQLDNINNQFPCPL